MNAKICWIFTALGLAWLVFLTGCEIDSADSSVRIAPDSATLAINASVTLVAQGGYEYAWSLSTEEWGTLNIRTGSQVVYTSLYEPSGDTPAVQVVTVVSAFSSSGSGGSSNDTSTSSVSSAEAYITHMPSGVEAAVE